MCRQSKIEFTLPWAMENVSRISRHSAGTDTYVSSGRLQEERRAAYRHINKENQQGDLSDLSMFPIS